MEYYPSKEDKLWNIENIYTIGYCHGLTLNVGAGQRTLLPTDITLDIDSDDCDYKADCTDLKIFKDETFDTVYASHILEHIFDLIGAIKEWTRVVKKGGHIVIICPDWRFTPPKSSLSADPQHKWDLQYEDLHELIKILPEVEQINKNIWAVPNFSFLMVLKKVK